jgi:hypothetical protein
MEAKQSITPHRHYRACPMMESRLQRMGFRAFCWMPAFAGMTMKFSREKMAFGARRIAASKIGVVPSIFLPLQWNQRFPTVVFFVESAQMALILA